MADALPIVGTLVLGAAILGDDSGTSGSANF